MVRPLKAFSLFPRVKDHDVQIMNLYWKESASLLHRAGTSRLVCQMFQINELFFMLSFNVFPCTVYYWVLFSADYHKWLPSKKFFNFYLFPVSLGQVYFILVLTSTNHKRLLMGVPNSQLTTSFLAKYQLTTIFLANSQLTTKLGKLLTFTFLQRLLFRHNPNFLCFSTSITSGGKPH